MTPGPSLSHYSSYDIKYLRKERLLTTAAWSWEQSLQSTVWNKYNKAVYMLNSTIRQALLIASALPDPWQVVEADFFKPDKK